MSRDISGILMSCGTISMYVGSIETWANILSVFPQRGAAGREGTLFARRQSPPCRCTKLKAHGQPILEKTRKKPMRLSLTISYHYFSPLSMG